MTLAVTFSSTSYLPASPEIATEFSTTTEILNYTNAGVLLAMGFSSLIWGPVGNLIGRKYAYNLAILMLCGCSAGAAAAVDMRMFTVMRILAGLTGTSFMVSGQTILADIFEPVCYPFSKLVFNFVSNICRSFEERPWAVLWLGALRALLLVYIHASISIYTRRAD